MKPEEVKHLKSWRHLYLTGVLKTAFLHPSTLGLSALLPCLLGHHSYHVNTWSKYTRMPAANHWIWRCSIDFNAPISWKSSLNRANYFRMCDIIHQRHYKFWMRFDSVFKFTSFFKKQSHLLSIIHGLTNKVSIIVFESNLQKVFVN